MTTTQTKRMTLDNFRALPEGPPYYEFEEGELIPVTSPTADHQDIISELNTALRDHARKTKAGRVFLTLDVFLPDGRVFIPDIAFLTNQNLGMFNAVDRKIHGAPDLAVEITSSNEARDRAHKFHLYYKNGVEWYWLISSKTLLIEEYRSTPEGYVRISSTESGETFSPQFFPGLSINLATLLDQNAPEE
jgi:Uma2 family endonuclease